MPSCASLAVRGLARAGAGRGRRAAGQPPRRARGRRRGARSGLGAGARHPQASRPELAPWLEHARTRFGCASPGAHGAGAAGARRARRAPGRRAAAGGAGRLDARAATRTRSTAIGRSGGWSRRRCSRSRGRCPASRRHADEWRALWARVGVSCDELSCTALTLGLRPHRLARGYLAGRLRAAARAGTPARADARRAARRATAAGRASPVRVREPIDRRRRRHCARRSTARRCCAPAVGRTPPSRAILDAAEAAEHGDPRPRRRRRGRRGDRRRGC